MGPAAATSPVLDNWLSSNPRCHWLIGQLECHYDFGGNTTAAWMSVASVTSRQYAEIFIYNECPCVLSQIFAMQLHSAGAPCLWAVVVVCSSRSATTYTSFYNPVQ